MGLGALLGGVADEESLVVDKLMLVAHVSEAKIGAGDGSLHELR